MKKRHFQFILAAAMAVLPFAVQAKLHVVASTPDFASIVEAIGDDKVDITTLAKPTEDPHFVDAKPSFILKLNRADLLVEGGAELEIGWLPRLVDDSRNTKVATGAPGHFMGNQGIQLLEVPATLDRSKGDIHAAGNPHFMTDPANALIVAQHLATTLCEVDPKNCDAYKANLIKFTDELNAKLIEWRKMLAPYQGKEVVAYHDSWPYFAKEFGLKIETFLEPKPGIPPTPSHLAEVIIKMKEDKINTIIVDPYQNRKTAETVARNTGATVVDVTQFPGGVKGTEGGYIQLIDYLVKSIAQSLGSSR